VGDAVHGAERHDCRADRAVLLSRYGARAVLRLALDPLRLTAAYAYDLPAASIAKAPADPPDAARLLVVAPGAVPRHATFRAFPELLNPGDVLVVNETRVIRARLIGTRAGGGTAEILLLRPVESARYDPDARTWFALVKPGRKLRPGATVHFGQAGVARIRDDAPDGTRVVELDLAVAFDALLERHGSVPLPHYVGPGDEARALRYQTIFARVPGSVAAPTASLHFTRGTMAALRERGVTVVSIALDIGLGTFRPIQSERIADHVMHAETYDVPAETARAIAAAKATGRRVVAAGTTVVRALESAAGADGTVAAGAAETRLFIAPGHSFAVVDALLTNFHLPASTLLVLVCTFGGHAETMAAYRTAVAEGYRFFSFGDAMFFERPAR
jgi:S-adenosylmethionine:tRNA ribosyltransferase-isomerase